MVNNLVICGRITCYFKDNDSPFLFVFSYDSNKVAKRKIKNKEAVSLLHIWES